MSVLVLLLFASLGVAALFLGGFIWAVRSGQYEDTCTPSLRPLMEEPAPSHIPLSGPNPDDEPNFNP